MILLKLKPHQLSLIFKRHFSIRQVKTNIRVRFAPSPTGDIHFGGFRTALFNYIYARQNNGAFILRIEDTDKTRLVPDAQAKLEALLHWTGIDPDESPTVGGNFGPYVQSERLTIYKKYAHQLVQKGAAYPCFCSDTRLKLMRKEAARLHQHARYDNRCRHLSPQEVKEKMAASTPHCIRFKLLEGPLDFQDIVLGSLSIDTSLTEGDPVIFKSDGFPTYHLACVVDDHLMEISHVLRGIEWHTSTPKHLMLYRALDWTPPQFAHLPLIMDSKGKKLSKRQGDVSLDIFKDQGYFPLALVNFAMCIGGGFGPMETDQLFSFEELIKRFSLERLTAHNSHFLTSRLDNINKLAIGHFMEDACSSQDLLHNLREIIRNQFSPDRLHPRSLEEGYMRTVLEWSKKVPVHTLPQLAAPEYSFLWASPLPSVYQDLTPDQLAVIQKVVEFIAEALPDFTQVAISDGLRHLVAQGHFSYRKTMHLLRLVLAGLKEGPGVAEMMILLGKEVTLSRLHAALDSEDPARSSSVE